MYSASTTNLKSEPMDTVDGDNTVDDTDDVLMVNLVSFAIYKLLSEMGGILYVITEAGLVLSKPRSHQFAMNCHQTLVLRKFNQRTFEIEYINESFHHKYIVIVDATRYCLP